MQYPREAEKFPINIAQSLRFAKPRKTRGYTVDLTAAPNPAETQIGLRFTLPGDATVTIEVTDALQRAALKPVTNERQTAGERSITIPSANFRAERIPSELSPV